MIETRRSHTLGRVIWEGTSQPDSGEPDGDTRRVLRAPADGVMKSLKQIGEHVEGGETIAVISGQYPVISPFKGVLRGLLRDRLYAPKGLKIGDIDPRNDPAACFLVSDPGHRRRRAGGSPFSKGNSGAVIRGLMEVTKGDLPEKALSCILASP